MKKGVTLIELLIVMTILGLMMGTFAGVYANGLRTFRTELTRTQLQTESQTITDRIATDIKKAITVASTADEKNLGPQTLILTTPAIDDNDNFLLDVNGAQLVDTIIYFSENHILKRKVLANAQSSRNAENGVEKILTTNLETINFSYTYPIGSINPTQIKTDLTVSKMVNNRLEKSSTHSTASPRNLP